MSFVVDEASLLVGVPGAATLAAIERALAPAGLTLGVTPTDASVASWLAAGAPGAPSSFADPPDHLLAGLTATLPNGRRIELAPSPRRSVGPDLLALFVGAREQFGTVEHAWLRVHRTSARRVALPTDGLDLDPPVTEGEAALVLAIRRELTR